ncbi:hypothetical protein [Streptomyces sp. NPDC002088]|uniref:hypothetical protein n=1 Tax=Streptomyces sp. NPDC002088 TaxID=3154665 RepID=UPI00332E46E7
MLSRTHATTANPRSPTRISPPADRSRDRAEPTFASKNLRVAVPAHELSMARTV